MFLTSTSLLLKETACSYSLFFTSLTIWEMFRKGVSSVGLSFAQERYSSFLLPTLMLSRSALLFLRLRGQFLYNKVCKLTVNINLLSLTSWQHLGGLPPIFSGVKPWKPTLKHLQQQLQTHFFESTYALLRLTLSDIP